MELDDMKAAVQRFNLDVIEKGDRAAFEALMDQAFINRSAPEGAPAGPESMWNTFQNVLRPALANLQVRILDQLAEADKVTTRKTITGVHVGTFFGVPPTGRSISIDVIDIVRLRDGRYLEHWGLNNLSSVVAALKAA